LQATSVLRKLAEKFTDDDETTTNQIHQMLQEKSSEAQTYPSEYYSAVESAGVESSREKTLYFDTLCFVPPS
jgi:hypothetical protein